MAVATAPGLELHDDASLLERARVALKSLWILKDENEDPFYARLLHLSMDRSTYERLAVRLRETDEGRRLLDERRTVPGDLGLDELEKLPEGTLGHAWARYYRDQGIHPFSFDFEVADDADYLTKRYRETHDIHHVVTGYGIDPLGEIELQAFYYGNLGFRHAALIVSTWTFAQFGYIGLTQVPDSFRRLLRAYRRGKAAPPILGVHFDEMWERRVSAITAEVCP